MPKAGVRRVAVIGAGYVGLPTAVVLSHHGHLVTIAEHDDRRYDALCQGRSPIVEHGLDEMLKDGLSTGRLRIVQRAADAVEGAEFVFLCVETPQADDGSADLSSVTAAASEIAPNLADGAIIVNKSTVPVGTVGLVERVVGRADVVVVSNPEFLREGTAVADSLNPDRVVVGADDREAAVRVAELFSDSGAPAVITDATTSELIKYASNAFLATKLTFINAMAGLCEAVGANVLDLVTGIGYDKRIGFEFLRPGPGWGGSCLPKDTSALLHIAKEAGYDFSLLAGAIASNDEQLARVIGKVEQMCGGSVTGVTLGVWGLTFKANTDDRRESPSLQITGRLTELGATVQAFDPTVDAEAEPLEDLRGLQLRADPYEAAAGARALVAISNAAGYDISIVRGAISGNDDQMQRVVDKVCAAAGGTLAGRNVAALGLSFKANTGDRRGSPAVAITRMLVDAGAAVRAFDPTVSSEDAGDDDLAHLIVCDSAYEAVEGGHAIALLTEWAEFRWLDYTRIRTLVETPAIVDARNLLDAGKLHRLGFTYSGIGRA